MIPQLGLVDKPTPRPTENARETTFQHIYFIYFKCQKYS